MSSRRWVFTVGVDPRQESTVPSRAILLGLAQSGTHSGHLRVGASPGTKEVWLDAKSGLTQSQTSKIPCYIR